MSCYFEIPLCCAAECVCRDGWHNLPPLIARRDPVVPSEETCTKGWWDTSSFEEAPVSSPWMPVYENRLTMADIEAANRAVLRDERAKARRCEPRCTWAWKVPVPWECTLPARVAVDSPVPREILVQKVRERVKPRSIRICGVSCPPIAGNWLLYQREPGEARGTWRRRVHRMVNNHHLARDLKYSGAFDDWSLSDQIDWLCQRLHKLNYYAKLSIDQIEEVVPFVTNNIQKVSKGYCVKVKNYGPSDYADRCLFNKMRLARLNQDRLELIPRQRQRRVAVVLCDRKTHVVKSLSSQLVSLCEQYFKQEIRSEPQPWGEMDDSKTQAGTDVAATSDKKSNVILEDHEGASTSSILPPVGKFNEYACLSVPKKNVTIESYTDRWITIKQGTWTKENFGEELFRINLPQDLLTNESFKNSPNYMPWRNHVYWHGPIKGKLVVNANSRQAGLLQFSWFPLASLDKNFETLRTNPFTASQRSHVLINAPSSNSGVINVEYSNHSPTMCISKGPSTWDDPGLVLDDKDFANLGTFLCLVMSPLVAAETTARSVSYSFLIAMEDPQFSGLIDASIVEGQMLPMASLFALQEVKSLLDRNRDNPTLSATGMPIVPVNAGSWCVGTGMPEWTNVLRLDPKSSLPYEHGRIPDIDEMKINYVTKIFGLIKTILWTPQHAQGTLLYKMDAAPVLQMNEYPAVPVQVEGVTYQTRCLPPLAMASSLLAYWRGKIDMRIDSVAAVELTGRVLVAIVPRCYKIITMQQAINCPHSIFDLQVGNRQFSFEIPYISDVMFWPRSRILEDEYKSYPPPSTVYIFVYNRLVANASIPSDCNLFIYVRGGDDFELSVPAFPTVGLGFFPDVHVDKMAIHQVIPISGYSPVYASSWHSFFTRVGHTFNPPILRYGAVSDHIAQFSPIGDLDKILYKPLKIKDATAAQILKNLYTIKGGVQCLDINKGPLGSIDVTYTDMQAQYFMAFLDEYGYCYMTVFPSHKDGMSYSDMIKLITNEVCLPCLKMAVNYRVNKSNVADFVTKYYEAFFLKVNSKAIWRKPFLPGTVTIFFESGSCYSQGDFYKPDIPVFIEAAINAEAGDQRTQVVAAPSAPQDSACGRPIGSMITFGERFMDFKDMCRRYQLYARGTVTVGKKSSSERIVILKFPVLPQGLDLITKVGTDVDHYWNRTRDGPIPNILSGYRFISGSIRMRLALDFVNVSSATYNNSFAKIFVQHRPDAIMKSLKVSHRSESILGTDDIEQSGYATYYQYDSMNNIISFEVPYYKPYQKGLLQRPVDRASALAPTGLGEVTVGFTLPSVAGRTDQIRYELYYKLGDDARASDFIGFPPVVDLTRIPPVDIVEPKRVEGSFENLSIEGEMGVWDWLPGAKSVSSISDAADKISQVDVEKLNETITESSSFIASLKENVKSCVPTFTSIKSKIDKYLALIINVITNFVHCLLNLNIRSVVTAIVSIFTQIKLVSFKCADKLVDALFSLFKKENPSATVELKEVAKEIINGESDDPITDVSKILEEEKNHRAAYLSTLIAGVAAVFALGPRMCGSDFKSCSLLLFDGIRKFALTANILFTFIKNNLIVMQRVGNILIDGTPKMKDIAFLEKEQAEMYAWACEVIDITDPWKESELFTSIKKASRVYSLCAAGSLILLKMSNIKLTMTQVGLINKLRDQIEALRNRLAKAHMAPPVRFLPFIYELTGPTGTGKSEILNDLPYKLLDHLNLKFRSEIIYHRALGNAYWNNCRNQPICSIDEKFPIAKQGFDDVQIAELFQLKSRCIFNPPMADLPDKNLRYNPLIVQYASNNAFPQLTGILDPTAVSRRRDMLIRVSFRPEITARFPPPLTMDRLPYELKRNWNALQFMIKTDPMTDIDDYVGPYTYDQLIDIMKKKWEQYYTDEYIKFQAHLQRALSLHPDGDAEFKTFDQQWQDMVDMDDPNMKVKEFRSAYLAVLDAYKKKEISEPLREARVIKLLKQMMGESESNISDDKMMERIKEARSKIKEIKDVPIVASVKPDIKGEVLESKTVISELEKLNAIYENSFKKQNCPHDLLIRCSELDQELFKYNREMQCWSISEFHMESVLNQINQNRDRKSKLLIEEFSCKTLVTFGDIRAVHSDPGALFLDEAMGRYIVSENPCGNLCKFQDAYNRNKFYKCYIANNPILKARLCNGSVDQLFSELPDEYANTLTKSVSESKDKIQKLKEEAGFFQNLYENIKESLMNFQWKKWFSKLAMLLGVFFFIGSIFKLWSCVTGPRDLECDSDALIGSAVGMAGINTCIGGVALMGAGRRSEQALTYEAEGFGSGDQRSGRTSKKTPISIARRHAALMAPQGQINDQLSSAVKNKIRRNTFFLQMTDPAGEVVHGRAMGVCGSYAVIIDHLWESFKNFKKDRVVYEFQYIGAAVPKASAIAIDFSQCVYTKFNDSALGLLRLPSRLGCFEDLRNFILPATRHMYVNGDGMVIELAGDKSGEVVTNNYTVKYSMESKIHAKGGKLYSDFTTGDTYRYPSFHGKGRCGSVLLALDQTAPIVGIHVAGNGNSGFSESIYREQFSSLENVISKSPPNFGEAVDVAKQSWFVDAQVKGVGLVPTRFAARAATKSRIIPSEVQEADDSPFPVVTSLAVLDKKDPRIADDPFSPMLEGVKHHGRPLLPFSQEDLQVAIEDYKNLVLAKCIPQRPEIGILPVLTAINGIEGKDLYDHIEWDSSEGFPFSSLRPAGAHDKRWMFDFEEEECVGFNRILTQAMDKKWKQRLSDEIPETIFIDCLKDCRVKTEKVLEPGKTRIFSIAPVDFTIQQRQCTLDFVTAFMTNRLELEHAIGIDVNSREWTDLANRLLKTGDKILTGDYSKFGDTIPTEIVHAAFQIICAWYRQYGILTWEHEQQLKIMGYEIANSTHLMFNFLYSVVCGQPSGNSLTVVINSIANSIYMRLAWLSIMRKTQYCTLVDLHKLVSWFSYGDDIIASLNELIASLFNATTLQQFFYQYGLKFTNANKGDEIVPYTNLVEAEFLKCSFKEHPYMKNPLILLAPLQENSVVETVNWINSDYQDKRLMSIQVCEDSLRNAFGRGPEFYNTLRQQLVDFWRKRNVCFKAETWTQLNFKVFELDIPINPYIKSLFRKPV